MALGLRTCYDLMILRSSDKTMTAIPKRILEETMRMPPALRAALAATLIQSLDEEADPDAEEAWAREIARRLRAEKNGKVKPIPWAVTRKRIFKKLHGRNS